MAITSELRRAGPFTGDGAQTEFPFTFKVFEPEEVAVMVSTDGGASESQLETTAYVCELNEDQDTSPGGTVTLNSPLAQDARLSILSQVEYTQPMVLTNRGGFYPELLNDSADRAVVLIQQLAEKVDRAVIVPSNSEDTPIEIAAEIFQAREDSNAAKEAAETAQAAAETAREGAQQALKDTEAAGETAVENIGAAKTEAVQAVDSAKTTAISAVETAGSEQITAIGSAKDAAVQTVQTEGATQKELVTAEGTKQVERVQQEGATQIEAVQAEGTKQQGLLQTQVDAAKASAEAAAESATAASTSATAADGSAKAAATSATSAQGSAQTASTAAGTATTKAEEAAQSASAASTSAQNAAKSATAASGSATAAAGSAEAAAESASSIGTAVEDAAASARAAASSASAAKTAKEAAEQAAKDAQDAAGSVGDPIGREEVERDYLKKSEASTTYLSKATADSTYLGKTAKAESAKTADAVTWANVSGKPTTVAGYGIAFASTTEAEAGTDTTKPMNAAATKAAIQSLAPAPDLSGYLTKTDAASTYLGKTAKAASASTADSAAKLTTARTLSLTGDGTASLSFDGSANASGALTLAASGATAGSYGPTADASVAFGGKVAVPQVTVDAKGRVTSIASRTITLPSGADLDDAATKTDILAACDEALEGMDVDPAGSPTLDAILSSLSALETDVPQKLGQDTVHIVSTWQSEDGQSWYRKYSDGWIEQGGETNFPASVAAQTLNVPFSNTNYWILASYRGGNSDDNFANVTGLNIKPYTTSQFKRACWGGSADVKGYWLAMGY